MSKIFNTMIIMSVHFVFGQPISEIELPQGGTDLKVKTAIEIVDFYVTRNHEIYHNGARLKRFGQIKDILLNFGEDNDHTILLLPFFYVDVRADYAIIDKIRMSMAGTAHAIRFPVSFSRTNLKGANTGVPFPIFGMGLPGFIETKSEEVKRKKVDYEFGGIPSIPDYLLPWWIPIHRKLTNGKASEIRELLDKYKYGHIKVVNGGKIVHNRGDTIPLQSPRIKEIQRAVNIMFIDHSEDLKFDSYFKFLVICADLIESRVVSDTTQFTFYELTEELKAYYNRIDVELKK